MTKWSLPGLLQSVASEVERSLADARQLIAHEGEKGGASEEVWRSLLRKHLPLRYQVDTGFVVDSEGRFSEQIDIIVFDRQYSPLVFELGTRKVFPVESVYAVFEVKQSVDQHIIKYADKKVGSVRTLYRTNLPVRDLKGDKIERPLPQIIGGFLSLESSWKPPFGSGFNQALRGATNLDLGCVANQGWVEREPVDAVTIHPGQASTTRFLFELIRRLQEQGTVPMIDMAAYARHLEG